MFLTKFRERSGSGTHVWAGFTPRPLEVAEHGKLAALHEIINGLVNLCCMVRSGSKRSLDRPRRAWRPTTGGHVPAI